MCRSRYARRTLSILFAVSAGCGAPAPVAERADDPQALVIALGGDVMFGRWLDDEWRPHHPGERERAAASELGAADLAVVNIETALCPEASARANAAQVRRQRHRFAAPPARLAWLAEVGVDVASVANNHALDCGAGSLEQTVDALSDHGLVAVGASRKARRAPSGQRVAAAGRSIWFVAASLHPAPVTGAELAPATVWRRDVTPLVAAVTDVVRRDRTGVVIVSLHWGDERGSRPSPFQRQLARRLIDAGAVIVHGHGSHRHRGVETYRNGVIAYDMGNLLFDMRHPDTRERRIQRIALRRANGTWRAHPLP